jgi:hypothetical protein
MSAKLHERLIEEFAINVLFTDHTKTGIRICWGHYLEISHTIDLACSISDAGNWPIDLPSFSKVLIVEVFISKSAWHIYKNNFSLVKKYYPEMISWLHQEITHEDEDQEVWGDYWSRYTWRT